MSSTYTKVLGWMAAGAVIAGGAQRASAQDGAATTGAAALTIPEFARRDDSMGLLQTEMSRRGIFSEFLDEFGLKLSGHISAAYEYNCADPPGGSNGWGRVFDDKSEDPTLNQIDLKLTRPIGYSAETFNMGFTVEVIYGSDARFTQANGTNFYGSGYSNKRSLTFFNAPPPFDNVVQSVGFPGQPDPENQFDFIQGYITANLPVANGVKVNAGKMIAPIGFEAIDPTTSPFYSHSYIFGLSLPRTITGVTGSYQYDRNWSTMGGVIVGWDQAFKDNNDFPSFVLQGGYSASDGSWSAVVTTVFGPEQADNDDNWRVLVDGTVWWTWDVFDFGVEGVFGWEDDISTPRQSVPTQAGPQTFQVFDGNDAHWFGGVAYGGLYIDEEKRFYTQGRIEYFNDRDGARLLSSEVVSATIGMKITPFPNHEVGKNFVIRPEIRVDCASDPIFDGGNQETQITFGGDIYFKF